jgi:hypothetical protein
MTKYSIGPIMKAGEAEISVSNHNNLNLTQEM